MSKKQKSFFDEKDIIEEESFFDDEDLQDVEMSESALRGAAQGITFDFADEILGAAEAGLDIATSDSEMKDFKDLYKKYRDIEREKFAKAKKANPVTYGTSDVLSGIVPALFTGGTTAAASVGKTGLQQAMKQAMKTGAKYGAATGLGMSEADLTEGDVSGAAMDVVKGGIMGAGTGVAIPAAGKALGQAAKLGKKGIEGVAKKMPTLTKPFKFAAKYGITSKDKRNAILQKDVENLLGSLEDRFQKLGLDKKTASEQAQELQKTYDVTGNLQDIADGIRQKARGLTPEDRKAANKIAEEVEGLFKTEQKLVEELQEELVKEVRKKSQKSMNKQTAATRKAEGKAVMEAEQKGLELEQFADMNKKYEDVAELPYDTIGGELKGGRATFRDRYIDPETGEEVSDFFQKKYLEDTTPFKPSPIQIGKADDQLVGQYMNEATGEVFRKYKQLPDEGMDFTKMSLDDILTWVEATQKKAFEESGPKSDMYKDLWKVGRNMLPEIIKDLPKNKQDFAKLFSVLRVLGIDSSTLQKKGMYSPEEMVDLIKNLPRKMDVEKDYLQRNLLDKSDEISKGLENIDLTSEVNKILEGSTGVTGEFTKAGVLQKGAGFASEAAGAMYGKTMKPIVGAAKKGINVINKMSDEALAGLSAKMNASQNKGIQAFGKQLEKAIQAEGPLKNALLWSLSQQPAFRKAAQDMDIDILGMFEQERNPQSTPEMPSLPEVSMEEEEEVDRSPAESVDVDHEDYPQDENESDLDYRKRVITSELLKKGHDERDVRAMLANMLVETGGSLDPAERQDVGSSKRGTYVRGEDVPESDWFDKKKSGRKGRGTGLIQWDDRRIALKKFAEDRGDSWDDLQTQIDFLDHELSTSERGRYKKVKAAPTTREKTYKFMKEVERAGEPHMGRRYKEAKELETEAGEARGEYLFGSPETLEKIKKIQKDLDRVMKMRSSGDETPAFEIERVFDGINQMDIPESDKLALQDEVVDMETYSDAEKIKELLEKYNSMS